MKIIMLMCIQYKGMPGNERQLCGKRPATARMASDAVQLSGNACSLEGVVSTQPSSPSAVDTDDTGDVEQMSAHEQFTAPAFDAPTTIERRNAD